MDKAKYGVLAGGVIGIIGCFLPFYSGASVLALPGATAISLLVAAGYVVGVVLGVVGLIAKFTRVFAIICTAGFALSTIKLFQIAALKGQIGGKVLIIGAFLGLVCSILVIIKPEE